MAGVVLTEVTASTSMLDEISIRPFSTISRRTTFPTKPPASKSSLPAPSTTRKSLFQCFEEARQTFEKKIVEPLTKSDPKRLSRIQEFLQGIKLDELGRVCRELSELAEDKANNKASKLLVTLDQFKGAGDALLQFAPESVHRVVWDQFFDYYWKCEGPNKAYDMWGLRQYCEYCGGLHQMGIEGSVDG
ncbi:hypothetical protein TWF594_003809 [Orbilia oligospora]|nr:hypothetical protein TWF594_003809 [Orbilia oligospora]